MKNITGKRIESIDFLRGVVMVIMALDHTREYFHLGSMVSDPTNLATTTPILFFTRFITHYCAPVFIFLSGSSAFLYGTTKTKGELSKFLFTRGLWLIFVDVAINNFLWWFDIHFGFFNLQVLWATGICMIILSVLIHLPQKILLALALLIICLHNTLDGIVASGNNPLSIVWYIIHQQENVLVNNDHMVSFYYPFLPWLGIMLLGYCFGNLYHPDYPAEKRKQWLLRFGSIALILFLVIRGINSYGDMKPWATQKSLIFSVLSFINVTKYPPSLLYTLITLGPAMFFLYFAESVKNKISDFFLVFGRVPFFYYLLHILVIHVFAIIGLIINGGNWRLMILDKESLTSDKMATYGYSLGTTYLVWIGIILLLNPICKKYMQYKSKNKDKWWLSYL